MVNDSRSKELDAFFASCSNFRDEFSAERIRLRSQKADEDEMNLVKEIEHLKQRKRDCEVSSLRCDAQIQSQRQEWNNLQSTKRGTC